MNIVLDYNSKLDGRILHKVGYEYTLHGKYESDFREVEDFKNKVNSNVLSVVWLVMREAR